ncbi:MAG: hypothetical protein GXO39_07085 [Thermotogae bacterium]|nr:hypothetical protein [Thermotogota bacterium]
MWILLVATGDSVVFERSFRIHPRYNKSFSLEVPADKVLILEVKNAPVGSFSVVLFDDKGFKYFQRDGDSSWSMHTVEDSTFTCYLNRSGTLHFVIWNNSYEERWIAPTVRVRLKEGTDSTRCFQLE